MERWSECLPWKVWKLFYEKRDGNDYEVFVVDLFCLSSTSDQLKLYPIVSCSECFAASPCRPRWKLNKLMSRLINVHLMESRWAATRETRLVWSSFVRLIEKFRRKIVSLSVNRNLLGTLSSRRLIASAITRNLFILLTRERIQFSLNVVVFKWKCFRE